MAVVITRLCVRKVFKYVWNQVHGAQGPSFKWDDAAKVNGDRKFGLMLKNGSEWADMIELKAKVKELKATRVEQARNAAMKRDNEGLQHKLMQLEEELRALKQAKDNELKEVARDGRSFARGRRS